MRLSEASALFERYLRSEKARSPETIRAYMSDLAEFATYLANAKGPSEVDAVDRFHVRGFLAKGFGKLTKTT
ncbi:MAG: site-specific integrase, partial [Pseudomonadota bacterium]